MQQDIDPASVRVLYGQRPQYYILGPLGCFYVGQRLELPGLEPMTVTGIDADGAGLARTDAQLSGFPPGHQFAQRTCYDVDFSGQASVAGMVAQCARNRREHGVVFPEDAAA